MGSPRASGNLWEPAPDTSRTRSLPDGCLGTRNAPLGLGSDQEQLLTALGHHCRSGAGRETGAHLEEGKRGVRRWELHIGLARCHGYSDANTGDQAGRSLPSLCKVVGPTQDPGRVDGARGADSSVGGQCGGRERAAATRQGKGILRRSVTEVRAEMTDRGDAEVQRPGPRSGGALGNHGR